MAGILLVTIGAVGASTGIMLWGIGIGVENNHDTMTTIGGASTIIGLILLVIGSVIYRNNEKRLEAALRK
jgi:amino acid transporter